MPMMARLCILLVALCLTEVNTSPLPNAGDVVDVRLVRHQGDLRVQRQAGNSIMPDVMVMTFPLGKDDVILRLQRARYPPTFLVGKDGIKEITDHNDSMSSVYVDPSRGAAFMVQQSEDNDFRLDGSLNHLGQQLLMKPLSRRKRSPNDVTNSHVLTPPLVNMPAPVKIVFDGDAEDSNATDDSQSDKGVPVKRRKRQTSGTVNQHVVETVFVIDHTDLAAWQTKFPSDTMAQIRQFYTYIGQTLNNIYSSVKDVQSSLDIKVAVTGLYIVQAGDPSITDPESGVLEGRVYLDDLQDWIQARSDFPDSDHYMAFTQFDLTFRDGPAVGVANSGEVCTSRSLSVVENSFSASVANIAAHELGHTLSAEHDGFSDAIPCSSGLRNVMTSTFFVPSDTPRNLFTFSSCSVSAFDDYLDSVTCTRPEETSAIVELPFNGYDSVLVTDRNLQCQLATGRSDSVMCDPARFENFDEADICIGMLCQVPSSIPMSLNCTYVLPLEGTSCGANLFCFRGECVDSNTVVQASPTFSASTTDSPDDPEDTTTSVTTTEAHATEPATTQASTTEAPTEAPTTESSTTEPATEIPTTESSTTETPSTETPTTKASTTDAPSTESPATEAPTGQTDTTKTATTEASTTEASTTEAQNTEAATTETPNTEAPTTEAVTTDKPTATETTTTETTSSTDSTSTDTTTDGATATEAPTTSQTTNAGITDAAVSSPPTTVSALTTTTTPTTTTRPRCGRRGCTRARRRFCLRQWNRFLRSFFRTRISACCVLTRCLPVSSRVLRILRKFFG